MHQEVSVNVTTFWDMLTASTLGHLLLRAIHSIVGTAVAQWLRRCATNRKVTGSIPDGVIGIFY